MWTAASPRLPIGCSKPLFRSTMSQLQRIRSAVSSTSPSASSRFLPTSIAMSAASSIWRSRDEVGRAAQGLHTRSATAGATRPGTPCGPPRSHRGRPGACRARTCRRASRRSASASRTCPSPSRHVATDEVLVAPADLAAGRLEAALERRVQLFVVVAQRRVGDLEARLRRRSSSGCSHRAGDASLAPPRRRPASAPRPSGCRRLVAWAAARASSASPCLPLRTRTPRRPARCAPSTSDHRSSPTIATSCRRRRGPPTVARTSAASSRTPSAKNSRRRLAEDEGRLLRRVLEAGDDRPRVEARPVGRQPPAVAVHADQRAPALDEPERAVERVVRHVARASRRSRPRPPPGIGRVGLVVRQEPLPGELGACVVGREDVERPARVSARRCTRPSPRAS